MLTKISLFCSKKEQLILKQYCITNHFNSVFFFIEMHYVKNKINFKETLSVIIINKVSLIVLYSNHNVLS